MKINLVSVIAGVFFSLGLMSFGTDDSFECHVEACDILLTMEETVELNGSEAEAVYQYYYNECEARNNASIQPAR